MNDRKRAEQLAATNEYRQLPCDLCKGSGFFDPNKDFLSGPDPGPCEPCEGTGRFWLPEQELIRRQEHSVQNGRLELTDSKLIERFGK